LRPLKSIPLLL